MTLLVERKSIQSMIKDQYTKGCELNFAYVVKPMGNIVKGYVLLFPITCPPNASGRCIVFYEAPGYDLLTSSFEAQRELQRLLPVLQDYLTTETNR